MHYVYEIRKLSKSNRKTPFSVKKKKKKKEEEY